MDRREFLGVAAGAGLQLQPTRAGTARPGGRPYKLSAMAWAYFGNVPVVEKLDKLAEAGYDAVELVREHQGFSEADWKQFLARKAALKMTVDTMAGHSAPAVDPAAHEKVLEEIRASAAAAQRLECPSLIVFSGNERAGVPRAEQHRAMVEVLKRAAEVAEKENLFLYLEPLNTLVDHKGYYLWSAREGFELVREVGHPRLKLLFDIYHVQIMEGNLIENIRMHVDRIGHFHIGDVPGRHEPGTGEINYRNVFKAIFDLGDRYLGYAALEYRPLAPLEENLAAVRKLTSF